MLPPAKRAVPIVVLDPVEVVEVPFYNRTVPAALVYPEHPLGRALYVPIRPLCDGLGLSWAGQQQRIHRDPVLSRHARIVRVTHTNPAGGNPNMLCLPLDRVNGWLFGISATRVKEDLRDAVAAYQEELYDVIYDYCASKAGVVVSRTSTAAPALPEDVDFDAIAHDLQHVRVGVDGMLDYLWRRHQHDEVVRRLLEMVRLDVHEVGGLIESGDVLTERQRQTLYQLGLEVAALMAQLEPKRNPFAVVFGSIKKTFDVPTYRQLPRRQYRKAHEHLSFWKDDLKRQIKAKGEEPCIS